jgi:flavodoxin
MQALVVYDSYFGNTEKVAKKINAILQRKFESRMIKVKDCKSDNLSDLDLLIVGSPTRAFSPSEHIKPFLKGIPSGELNGVKIAAFDTRADEDTIESNWFLKILVKIFGYAAKPMQKTLVQKGGHSVAEPTGFIVTGKEGPLKEGELKKAKNWTKTIISNIEEEQI